MGKLGGRLAHDKRQAPRCGNNDCERIGERHRVFLPGGGESGLGSILMEELDFEVPPPREQWQLSFRGIPKDVRFYPRLSFGHI